FRATQGRVSNVRSVRRLARDKAPRSLVLLEKSCGRRTGSAPLPGSLKSLGVFMEELKSTLDTGRERFLATSLGYALAHNWVTHQDLMRAFPPDTFMRSLESAPGL